MKAIFFYGDGMFLIQVANSFLKNFLAYMKKALDVLRIALVAQGTIAIVLLNILQQFVGEFKCFLSSTCLQRTVDLTIGAHIGDIALKFVACVYILENLINA